MVHILHIITNGLLLIATLVLAGFSVLLIGYAGWNIVRAVSRGEDPVHQVVGSVSLIIIAFAVLALANYIAEEEIERDRELRSPREARRSLTKFMTIIVIAFSLEALVMVFEAHRGDAHDAIYAAALFATVVFALVGLGAYQWLSMQVERAAGPSDRATSDDDGSRDNSRNAISGRTKPGDDDGDSRDRPGYRNHRA